MYETLFTRNLLRGNHIGTEALLQNSRPTELSVRNSYCTKLLKVLSLYPGEDPF